MASRSRRPPVGLVLVVLTCTSMVLLAVRALNGTAWNFNGLYSDAGFRTEAATRFADSPALADYAYRGLPSYYPPALAWIEGRAAALLDVPAWTTMKPVTLVLAALVPLLAYCLWRRVLAEPVAGCVTAATALLCADLVKPDEWLLLMLVVPWWLEVVRGARRVDVRPWPAWLQGVVLGCLLLWYSFYFVPLAVATLAGFALDLVRRSPAPLRPGRAVVVGVVGLVVGAPYWLPTAWLRLTGAPMDNLQLRWTYPGFDVPPVPGIDLVGLFGCVGVVWLVIRARRDRVAGGLALALVCTYAFDLVGQWLQRYGVAVLPEKSDALLAALLVTTGVLGLAEAVSWSTRALAPRVTVVVAVVVAVAVALPTVDAFRLQWTQSRHVSSAQHMRYPDGSWPSGGPGRPSTHRHPWGVRPDGVNEPSVDQVASAWHALGGRLDDRTVLVTARADILATTPVHPFTTWKSIYSNPAGRFNQRVALLERVRSCSDSRCAWRLLRHNDFDRVDGLVLTRVPEGLRLAITTDDFPDGWKLDPVTFRPALFASRWFTRRDVEDVAVIRLR